MNMTKWNEALNQTFPCYRDPRVRTLLNKDKLSLDVKSETDKHTKIMTIDKQGYF